MNKKQHKKLLNARRHKFLLTFFGKPHGYSYKEVNGFILVRQRNNSTERWEVAIWDKETWIKCSNKSLERKEDKRCYHTPSDSCDQDCADEYNQQSLIN